MALLFPNMNFPRPTPGGFFRLCLGLLFCYSVLADERADQPANHPPEGLSAFLETHCWDCHDSESAKGQLDLETLSFDLRHPETFEQWVMIHDRVQAGEMPPPKKRQPNPTATAQFLERMATTLVTADQDRIDTHGRSKVRRLNRFEYENKLRYVLRAPWLIVAERLPVDGIKHLFSKSGEILDVSHVQMEQYLTAAEYAVRTAMNTIAHPTSKKKYYAREERSMQGYLRYRWSQSSATRAAIPLLGTTPEPEVIRGNQPVTVGEADPVRREKEAFGFVSGTYTATTKYDFTRMRVPTDGIYRLRLKSYSFLAGPNGRSGGDDHGLSGGRQAWWRPSRTEAFRGQRSEPITLYALSNSGDSRWLTTYDAHPDPAVIERTVTLKQGEGIRPDAARLVRTRPGWKGNPLATKEGIPGFALNWLEVEGPIHSTWPPASYQALFADTGFELTDNAAVMLTPEDEEASAKHLIARFISHVFPVTTESTRSPHQDTLTQSYFTIYQRARELQQTWTDAMVMTFAAVLCSPEFLYLDFTPGELTPRQLATRLAYFLWESPPDQALLALDNLTDPAVLSRETDRLLDDPKSHRFRDLFLNHWLDLGELNANTPDAELYPDYYLHDLLTESSLRETRLYFQDLITHNRPAKHLVQSDVTYLNECLQEHYGLPLHEGVEPHRVTLPPQSPRGGLLTQASILRVTANGTTTSPVIRGAWVMERIMGLEIPPPPSGVEAVEPDTRGATTIREQLDQHRANTSCHACHAKFDPPGFALESFDIAGGWRERYRAVDPDHKPKPGLGKNGHQFLFHEAKPIDSQGQLLTGETFRNITELKSILAEQERQIARNLVRRLIAYATGAPVSFAERREVEEILDHCRPNYGIRSLLHSVVQSKLFRIK